MLSGTVAGTYQSDTWTLHEDGEDRKFTTVQQFSTPFIRPPTVVVSISEVDAPAGPLRVRVAAADITNTGFTVEITTWADSKLYGAVASWIAYES
jgi:hypothetical protein